MGFDLAQVNVSRLLAPLNSPQLAQFVAALDEVNASGDAAPGFRWRLQTDDGNATAVQAFGWDVVDSYGVIVNLTTWTSVEALADWVFSGPHLAIMRRRREWFQRPQRRPPRCGGCLPGTAQAPTTPSTGYDTCAGTALRRPHSPSAAPSPLRPSQQRCCGRATTGCAQPDRRQVIANH